MTRLDSYRLGLAIDDCRPGRRGSLVNFHSLRQWFITAALRAGQPDQILNRVIGHSAQSLARRVYFSGDREARLRECVEAVKLPAKPASNAAAVVSER